MTTTATYETLSASEHSTQLRKAVIASTIGTAIEWYDFFLYGTAAGLIFGKLFFPNSDPLTATLAAFGTYPGWHLPPSWNGCTSGAPTRTSTASSTQFAKLSGVSRWTISMTIVWLGQTSGNARDRPG